MNIQYKNIQIRNATPLDAPQLCTWWNDGKVMAHAGFPYGLGISAEKIVADIYKMDDMRSVCIILYDNKPIGEMDYHISEDKSTADIGIKICNADKQNHGLGKLILSLFIQELFSKYGVSKIKLDPNLKNTRAQHVYEQLGFQKTCIEWDSWTDQLGQLQSAVLYELTPEQFISYIS